MAEELEIPVWWNNGSGIIRRRDALPINHPEHTYNYVKRVFNVDPEDYGVEKPGNNNVCPNCGEML